MRRTGNGAVAFDALAANVDQEIAAPDAGRTASPRRRRASTRPALLIRLLDEGLLTAAEVEQIVALAAEARVPVEEVLTRRGFVSASDLCDVLAESHRSQAPDLRSMPPDPRLVDALGLHRCLELGVLPWRQAGRQVIVLAPYPGRFDRALEELSEAFPTLTLGFAPPTRSPRR